MKATRPIGINQTPEKGGQNWPQKPGKRWKLKGHITLGRKSPEKSLLTFVKGK
jgi:hypothetical protein